MTVAELIARLEEMPQDSRVVVDGCEGGLEDVSSVSTCRSTSSESNFNG